MRLDDMMLPDDLPDCGRSHQGSECGGFRCPNCQRWGPEEFSCPCGAGTANHVLLIPDYGEGTLPGGGYDDYDPHSAENETGGN